MQSELGKIKKKMMRCAREENLWNAEEIRVKKRRDVFEMVAKSDILGQTIGPHLNLRLEIPESDSAARSSRETAFVLLTLAGALGIRLWNITWGFPELYEEATPFRIAAQMWRWGKSGLDLNPHFFNYPAFTFYFHFLLQGAQYGVGHILGIYPDPLAYGSGLEGPVLLARVTSVLFDLGSVVLVYGIARKFTSPAPAIMAAALSAVNPLQVRESHLINVDTPLTFFALLAIYFALEIYSKGSRSAYVLAGLSIGLATACKYTGAFLFPVLAAAHVLRYRKPADALRSLTQKNFLAAVALSFAVFLFFNPYILLSFDEFMSGISFEEMHMSYGHLGLDTSQSSWNYYLLHLFPAELGWPLYLTAVAGFILLPFTRRKEFIVVTAFPIIVTGVICSWTMRADRYALPVIPSLIVIGMIGITGIRLLITRAMAARSPGLAFRIPGWIGIAATVVILGYPATVSVLEFQHASSLPDTRAIAKNWIADHLPRGSAYATGPFGIEFAPGAYAAVEIPFSPTGSEALAPFYDTRWYVDLDLLIASDYDEARFAREPARFRDILGYYDSLRTRWNLAFEIRPDANQGGPTLWLYRPPASPHPALFDQDLFQHLSLVAETSLVTTFAERLAYALFTKGIYPRSEQLMLMAVSFQQKNTQYLKELAWTQFRSGEFARALATVDSSLRINPAQPEVRGLRGSTLMRLGKIPEAEADLNRALAMNERLQMPYLDLEAIYAHIGDRPKLTGILRRHLKIAQPGSETAQQIEQQLARLANSP